MNILLSPLPLSSILLLSIFAGYPDLWHLVTVMWLPNLHLHHLCWHFCFALRGCWDCSGPLYPIAAFLPSYRKYICRWCGREAWPWYWNVGAPQVTEAGHVLHANIWRMIRGRGVTAPRPIGSIGWMWGLVRWRTSLRGFRYCARPQYLAEFGGRSARAL